jgi:hypothetical protein
MWIPPSPHDTPHTHTSHPHTKTHAADTTFNDEGEDAAGYGFPPPRSYVFNLTNMAEGGTPFGAQTKYINQSGMAEGLVGGELPVVVFYFPVVPNATWLPPNGIPAGAGKTRIHCSCCCACVRMCVRASERATELVRVRVSVNMQMCECVCQSHRITVI